MHYYFGSNENLLVAALERFTGRLVARQRALYATDLPFAEKWREAMHYLVSEDVTYEKIWLELQALSWNNPSIRDRLTRVNADWRRVLTERIRRASSPHEHRDAAGGAGLARRDVQPRNHGRAPGRHHRWAR